MATLALMLAAVVIALAIGLPLGILAGRSNRAQRVLSPILDVMQIMPTFAYLTPITLLFLIGAAPSTIATLIYAIPPAIRITALGIRGVPATTVEAAPVARLDRIARSCARSSCRSPGGRSASAINQTIMLALSMVVITGLIGAPGLGRNILTSACRKVDVGAAFDAGLAIVILAIVLDRLTYAAGEWLDPAGAGSPASDGRRGAGSRSARRSSSSRVGLARPVRRRRDRSSRTTIAFSFARPGQRRSSTGSRTRSRRDHARDQERRHDRRPEPARERPDVVAVVAGRRRRRR